MTDASLPIVLLVEDEALIRLGLADVCENAGFRVLEAPDGLEAIAVLQHHPEVRAVVTDLDMPRMDGLALTAAVRRDYPSIEVIITSGKSYLRPDQLPVGVRFFEKPINEQDLVGWLHERVRRSHAVG